MTTKNHEYGLQWFSQLPWLRKLANFNEFVIKITPPNKVARASLQIISANERSSIHYLRVLNWKENTPSNLCLQQNKMNISVVHDLRTFPPSDDTFLYVLPLIFGNEKH